VPSASNLSAGWRLQATSGRMAAGLVRERSSIRPRHLPAPTSAERAKDSVARRGPCYHCPAFAKSTTREVRVVMLKNKLPSRPQQQVLPIIAMHPPDGRPGACTAWGSMALAPMVRASASTPIPLTEPLDGSKLLQATRVDCSNTTSGCRAGPRVRRSCGCCKGENGIPFEVGMAKVAPLESSKLAQVPRAR